MEEVSLTIDEAKLKKMVDEMLRQRCTSGDEHQYHIDQMKNFLKVNIVWETKKEILISSHPRKTTPLVQSCQRDPEAPPLSLINKDLLYLKKGSSGPEKIVLSLHKFPAIIFDDDDIEERTSRWVNKCVKKFNPYARYGVEHWKNPHAKIFYIRKQKEPGKLKELIYSNSKIIQPDYKNLNKNDIEEDMYLLVMNGKVPNYAETGLLWSLSVFIRISVIWERVHDFQLGIESYQQKVNLTAPIISFPKVENTKCSPSSMSRDLTNEEVEYLKLLKEEIEVRLKYHNQPSVALVTCSSQLQGSTCTLSALGPMGDRQHLSKFNKNDIEDMYLLIMNGKIPDYAETGLLWSLSVFIRSSVIWERVHDFQLGIESYQQKVNLTAPTISFPGVEKHKMFSIIYEPVHGIIYKNSKKEKRVMRHSEIHKFCDATLLETRKVSVTSKVVIVLARS
ncbi:hypothetical protein Tco_1241679 [Tanacetum coccineum]